MHTRADRLSIPFGGAARRRSGGEVSVRVMAAKIRRGTQRVTRGDSLRDVLVPQDEYAYYVRVLFAS